MSPGSGSGGGCRWAGGWESLPARPGPEPGTPPVSSHQVPGITGALSGLGAPAAPLEGEDHVPAPVRVEHRVPGRDVDVEKLGWAARGLHAHQVREHVVACPQRGRACKDQLRTTLPSASGIWTPPLPLKLQKMTQPLLASPSLDLLHLSQCFVTPWSKLLSLPVWSSPW